MRETDYKQTYVEALNRLMEQHSHQDAVKLAVGGNFEAFGAVMRAVLIQAGLQPSDYLVDVGCGSGRLALALRSYLTGRYLGIDVVPDLLAYARQAAQRPDWRFEEARGIAIPEADETANMVCFFSVLTHLMHEDSYRYLLEARRVLKPGGTIVFSFLDFSVDTHWTVFEGMLAARQAGETTHHNQFMGRDAAMVWAGRLDLDLVALLDGHSPQVRLDEEVVLDDGRVLPRDASLGQSICILRKPAMTDANTPPPDPALSNPLRPDDHARLHHDLLRSAIRVAQLEARLAEAERRMNHVANDVQTIVHTRSWRALHALAAALRAPFSRKRQR